ncbi:oligosaccharide flippase family protein [Gracilimonas tropica]|uniref:oligosaccharide flippase family protein n=1 Tax=Gracilimonas tropica TaxID=454600 RepID=UPI00039DE2E4|nr:oligosaccharide flippase family protein [Gracilimonas tropica]
MKEKERSKYSGLTSNKVLAQNTLITILAKVFPLVVGIFALPYLISELGEEKFGMLAIIWLIISYFSMFDLGIGRAVVKEVSDLIGANEYEEIPVAAWTGIISIFLMGILGGLILYVTGELILNRAFDTTNQVAVDALLYTSFAVPFIVATTGFRAVLMAEQNFFAISVIQSINSILNYLLPLLLLYFFGFEFIEIVIALLILKIVAFFAFAVSGLISEPSLRSGTHFNKVYLSKMFHFGKWVTISNVVGPLISQLDRYFIAAVISVSAVTFYTTPLEVLTKLMMVPMAFITVLFPAFSTLASKSHERREKLYLESSKGVMLLLFPTILIISTFADYGLKVWVGAEFVEKSTFVAQIFCVVFFLRGIAYIPATYLPGLNRPDLPAKFHLFEIIVFVTGLYFAARTGDINIVAFVSLGITALDTLLLLFAAFNLLEQKSEMLKKIVWPMIFGALILLSLPFLELVMFYMTSAIALTIYLITYHKYLFKITGKLKKALLDS